MELAQLERMSQKPVTRLRSVKGMHPMSDKLTIHVNIEISGEALQTIVENGKAIVGRDEKGHFKVDTADLTATMISRFLDDKGFDDYVRNPDHYAFYFEGGEG
jgi:hypothetical protein